jgi:DNA-binding LytR/AlgR family response regulator
MLPPAIFCRIHHGHIVNLKQVDRLQKARGGTVIMKDGKALELAVRRKEEFLKMFRK